jgi:YVTN family beta-propeller protein
VTASIPVGVLPFGLALNPSTGLLYVANEGDSTVSVVATATSSVVATIPLAGTLQLGGAAAATGVAVNPTTNTVYVAEAGAAQVAVVDGATNTLTSTWPVAPGPWGLAVNTDTNTVYVSSLAGSVTVLDGSSGAVQAVIRDARLQRPTGIAVNPTTNQVFVANLDGNSVAVIDGTRNRITAVVPVGKRPAAVAIDQASGMVYVANTGEALLTVIDPTTNGVLATWATGNGPVAVVVDQATRVVYVAARDNSVRQFDHAGQLLGTLIDPALTGLQGLAAGSNLYVSSGATNVVVVAPLVQPAPAAP